MNIGLLVGCLSCARMQIMEVMKVKVGKHCQQINPILKFEMKQQAIT